MKHLYPNYSFDVTSTLVGAAGFATKDLPMNFLKIDIENIRQTCRICQEKALIDSTGNCETYKQTKINIKDYPANIEFNTEMNLMWAGSMLFLCCRRNSDMSFLSVPIHAFFLDT